MDSFSLIVSDGHSVACYAEVPDNPRAIIQIAHGMGEHAKRYAWVAEQLAAQGYAVYASDHRGHGDTAGEHLGYMGADGWNRCLADLYEINRHLRQLHPNLPLCLLGHSMGSMLSQQYITRYGRSIEALVLSGSPGFKQARFGFLSRWILRFENWRLDPWAQSAVMQKALFESSNKSFDEPGATGYEWLSRDADEVRKYVADPKCGFVLSIGSIVDMNQGLGASQSGRAIEKIPVNLPMYVFSGSVDPVHGEQADLDRMVERYRGHGMEQLDYKLYPGGRHEMFNEINRDEVIQDLIRWLGENL